VQQRGLGSGALIGVGEYTQHRWILILRWKPLL